MNRKERSQIREVLERLAKLEAKHELGLKFLQETLSEIKEGLKIINEEMGSLDQRITQVERFYEETRVTYRKIVSHWKIISFFISPVVTTLIIYLAKFSLGIP